jgi:hypothetical protein
LRFFFFLILVLILLMNNKPPNCVLPHSLDNKLILMKRTIEIHVINVIYNSTEIQ